jgi:glyoxylase-like metal-dependent hydrolase (beta-lactamase superfamily II)
VPKKIVGSCYLIRHGERYMLWDTGLAESLIGKPYVSPAQTVSLKRSLVDQLAELGIKPEQIEFVGISHWHFDHVSKAARFPQARLLIGKGDADTLRANPSPDKDSTEALKHWLSGPGQMEAATKDLDVFRDGRVVMLTTPGHTRPQCAAGSPRLRAGAPDRGPLSLHRAGREPRGAAVQP